MGVRSRLATWYLRIGRKLGRGLGCELVVDLDPHEIDLSMEVPGKNPSRAWDPDLFHRGQLFMKGYANPIKPYVRKRAGEGLAEDVPPDEIALEGAGDDDPSGSMQELYADGGTVQGDDTEVYGTAGHVEMESSQMYKTYQDQKLASELVNPREELKLIFWALLAIIILLVLIAGLNIGSIFV